MIGKYIICRYQMTDKWIINNDPQIITDHGIGATQMVHQEGVRIKYAWVSSLATMQIDQQNLDKQLIDWRMLMQMQVIGN